MRQAVMVGVVVPAALLLVSYAAVVVRLAMPSVPLSTCQAGSLIQALALVQPHASCRESAEALSA